jgi:hypothetical protein
MAIDVRNIAKEGFIGCLDITPGNHRQFFFWLDEFGARDPWHRIPTICGLEKIVERGLHTGCAETRSRLGEQTWARVDWNSEIRVGSKEGRREF